MWYVFNPLAQDWFAPSWWVKQTEWTWTPTEAPTKVWEEYLDTNTGTRYKAVGTSSTDDRIVL